MKIHVPKARILAFAAILMMRTAVATNPAPGSPNVSSGNPAIRTIQNRNWNLDWTACRTVSRVGGNEFSKLDDLFS